MGSASPPPRRLRPWVGPARQSQLRRGYWFGSRGDLSAISHRRSGGAPRRFRTAAIMMDSRVHSPPRIASERGTPPGQTAIMWGARIGGGGGFTLGVGSHWAGSHWRRSHWERRGRGWVHTGGGEGRFTYVGEGGFTLGGGIELIARGAFRDELLYTSLGAG